MKVFIILLVMAANNGGPAPQVGGQILQPFQPQHNTEEECVRNLAIVLNNYNQGRPDNVTVQGECIAVDITTLLGRSASN